MILAEILAHKRLGIAAAKTLVPQQQLWADAVKAPPVRGFKTALHRYPGVGVIAEIKKASPSKGVIRADFNPVHIARAYEAAGASCLSVLTDEQFFAGSLQYLREVRAAVQLPLLRKDFIIDEYQVYESREAGADAILLIVAAFHGECAEGREPDHMYGLADAARSLGMDVLVEVHNPAELEIALRVNGGLIGINNRDLKSFHTTLDVTLGLAPLVPADRLLVSESGIVTHADVERLGAAGAKAVLVGESLMRQADVGAALRALLDEPQS